ncbi:MAG: TAXI family TRAP transporter solute-binding subunit [Pseudomonadota bacterium]
MEKNRSANVRRAMLVFVVILLIGHIFLSRQAYSKEDTMPRAMAFATHPVGSLFYTLGSGLSKLFSSHLPTTVSVQPFTSAGAWFPMMNTGELLLGIMNNYDPWAAYRALEPFKDKYPGLRLLFTGGTLKLGYLVAAKSDFKTVADLKGKRVAYGKGMPGQRFWAEALFEAAGLKVGEDVKVVPTPNIVDPVRAIMDGRADAGAAAVGMAVVQEASAKLGGVRYLPAANSPDEERIIENAGPCDVCVAKKGPPGIAEDTPLVCMRINVLASEYLSEEAAYQIVKTVWDYEHELVKIHVAFNEWTHQNMVYRKPVVPYHTGAVKFFKEQNLWTPELEKTQQELLAK